MGHNRKIAVIGLGYVGLPVAVSFGTTQNVIAFDISEKRLEELKSGIDVTNEVEPSELQAANLTFTAQIDDLKKADFFIVAVPTPIDSAKKPDLAILKAASKTAGQALKKGDIVVFESTVYPGATEEDCLPILEKESGLKAGVDFFIGYSPERINPGDKEHTFTKITKVVSAQTKESLDVVASVYESVVKAGVHRAASIRVAEAAKVIENIQRDINVALINELSLIFDKLGIDTQQVLEAAGTKWNFLPFKPGLVGGHCIGVDPYYLAHKAAKEGAHPELILAGRRINDSMGLFAAEQVVKHLIQQGSRVKGSKVIVLGVTFKENCPDLRNTKVIDVINALEAYGIEIHAHDPLACPKEYEATYGKKLCEWKDLPEAEAVVLAVPHQEYIEKSIDVLIGLTKSESNRLFFDIKGALPGEMNQQATVWRL